MTCLDPGPCDYCKSISAACQIDKGKRKQRPYYYVSEEEYALLKKIVQHQIPDEHIDLSVLREFASQLDANDHLSPSVRSPSVLAPEQQPLSELQDAQDPHEALAQGEERVVAEEIKNLHADLGCMMVDSTGEYSTCHTPPKASRCSNGCKDLSELIRELASTQQFVD